LGKVQISERYAKSLFELAQDEGVLDEVQASLQDVGEMVREVPPLGEFLHNPLLSVEERQQVLKALFEKKVPALVQKFLLFINFKGRLNLLAPIIEAFDDLYLRSHNRVRAVVQTALPLDKKQKEDICRHLNQKYAKEIVADWQVEEGLLGGFRILVEGKLHDYSFTSQLESFRQKVLQ